MNHAIESVLQAKQSFHHLTFVLSFLNVQGGYGRGGYGRGGYY